MSLQIKDSGKVRFGGASPSLPLPIKDSGKVRLGGASPSLPRGK